MITPSYLGETIEYSSLHACRSTLEDPRNNASDWKTSATRRRWGGSGDSSSAPNFTQPRWGRSRPAMAARQVLLPAPEGPNRTVTPGGARKAASSRPATETSTSSSEAMALALGEPVEEEQHRQAHRGHARRQGGRLRPPVPLPQVVDGQGGGLGGAGEVAPQHQRHAELAQRAGEAQGQPREDASARQGQHHGKEHARLRRAQRLRSPDEAHVDLFHGGAGGFHHEGKGGQGRRHHRSGAREHDGGAEEGLHRAPDGALATQRHQEEVAHHRRGQHHGGGDQRVDEVRTPETGAGHEGRQRHPEDSRQEHGGGRHLEGQGQRFELHGVENPQRCSTARASGDCSSAAKARPPAARAPFRHATTACSMGACRDASTRANTPSSPWSTRAPETMAASALPDCAHCSAWRTFSANTTRDCSAGQRPADSSAWRAATPYGACSGLAMAMRLKRSSASASSGAGTAPLTHTTSSPRAQTRLESASHAPDFTASSTQATLAAAKASKGAPALSCLANSPEEPKVSSTAAPVCAWNNPLSSSKAGVRSDAAATRTGLSPEEPRQASTKRAVTHPRTPGPLARVRAAVSRKGRAGGASARTSCGADQALQHAGNLRHLRGVFALHRRAPLVEQGPHLPHRRLGLRAGVLFGALLQQAHQLLRLVEDAGEGFDGHHLVLLALGLVVGALLLLQLFHLVGLQGGAGVNHQRLGDSGGGVHCSHRERALVGELEGHFDGHVFAADHLQVGEHHLAQAGALVGPVALSLVHRHARVGLTRFSGQENLLGAGRHRRVLGDEPAHRSAQHSHRERVGGHVDEQRRALLLTQLGRMHRSAQGHHFVGVDTPHRLATEEVQRQAPHQGDPGHAPHQHHGVDGLGVELGVAHHLLAHLEATLGERLRQALEEVAGERGVHMGKVPGAVGRGVVPQLAHRDEGFAAVGEGALGPLGGVTKALHRQPVLRHFGPVGFGNLGQEPLHDAGVEVVAAQLRVSAGGLDLEHPLLQFEDGDVEGAAAQVEHQRSALEVLRKAVGHGRGGGLVDDAQHLEAGDARRFAGGVALGVVEVRRNGDDRLAHRATEVRFRVELQLAQNHRRHLGDGQHLARHLDAHFSAGSGAERVRNDMLGRRRQLGGEAPPDVALGGGGHAVGRFVAQQAGLLSDDPLAHGGEADDGRREPGAGARGNQDRVAPLHGGHGAVGRSEVDADDGFHGGCDRKADRL